MRLRKWNGFLYLKSQRWGKEWFCCVSCLLDHWAISDFRGVRDRYWVFTDWIFACILICVTTQTCPSVWLSKRPKNHTGGNEEGSPITGAICKLNHQMGWGFMYFYEAFAQETQLDSPWGTAGAWGYLPEWQCLLLRISDGLSCGMGICPGQA